MKTSRLVIMSLLLVALLFLVACSSTDTNNTPEATPIPLPQSTTNEESGLTVNYPEGWSTMPDGKRITFSVSSTESEERLFMLVEVVSTENASELGVTEEASIEEVVQAAISMSSNADMGFTEVIEFDAAGKPAAMSSGTLTRGEESMMLKLTMVDMGDVYVMLMASGTEGLMTDIDATLRSMAASLVYNPA